MLNQSKGNMYGFVTHTWNAIKGKCIHDCSYCYMKVFPQGELRFDEKELKTDLGKGNFIFVGSSTDMFAENVPKEWIFKVLEHCNKYPENTYLFQSKNPERFKYFLYWMPKKIILGTTVETNDMTNYEKYSKAPLPSWRLSALQEIPEEIDKMISIEPLMDFEEHTFYMWIKDVKPKFVSVGADSKGHKLPEPSNHKIFQLLKDLEKFTEVRNKENLSRLLK
jgi:DNA repair photolyase